MKQNQKKTCRHQQGNQGQEKNHRKRYISHRIGKCRQRDNTKKTARYGGCRKSFRVAVYVHSIIVNVEPQAVNALCKNYYLALTAFRL